MSLLDRHIVCFILLVGGVGVSSITVNNGKYEDVNIVIQNTVAENEKLLNRIKNVFTDASQRLFQASKQHVCFGKINIIVPKNWTTKSEYTIMPARSELDTYVTVEDGRIQRPHTKPKNGKCGQPMKYLYLPQSFLLEEGKTKYGHHGNVLVHEWAHLKWGLYEEYSTKKNERFYMKDGVWKPTRCSESVSGQVGRGLQCGKETSRCDTSNTRSKLDEDCKHCPDESQNGVGLGSVMAHNWIDGVSMFCDNPDDETVPVNQRHNKYAPNKHNNKCDQRSAWEIMREHEEFKNAPWPNDTVTKPEFNIIQESECYRVFVLDVSGSMTGSRIDYLYKSSKLMIEQYVAENSWLGIVTFSTTASTLIGLTQITSNNTRSNLVAVLPDSASGGTCIGCGIESALSMLTTSLGDPAGSAMIVISDGENNVDDENLDTIVQKAVDAQVNIHTLSVSQQADTRLISMAQKTGGIHKTYLETESISLTSVFMDTLACGITTYSTEPATLDSETIRKSSSNEASFSFDIDNTVGQSTTVAVQIENSTSTSVNMDIVIEVFGPDGTEYTEQATGNSIVLVLPGTAKAGQYNATVKTPTPVTFEYHVTSMPNDPEVIRVFSFVSPINIDFTGGELPVIYADVIKGRAPVLSAKVTAVVETGSKSCKVTLLDNGADPDNSKNDGTYSSVIPRTCLNNGRIATKVYARGQGGATFVLNDYAGAGSLDADEDTNNTEVLQDSFQRVNVPNEIFMTNVDDQDLIAPGRITDVDIVDIVTEDTPYGESRNFTITWTATGDDVNDGQATEYELRISDNQSVLINDFSSADLLDIVNTNFTPKAAGETEAIRLEVDAEETYVSTAYFAVRAKDAAGNVGQVSNIVSIVVATDYRIKVEADVEVVYSFSDDSIEESATIKKQKENLIGLAVGLSVAATAVVIAITAVTCCIKKLKAKEVVEDSVFSSDNTVKDIFTGVPFRQTVPKRTFQASLLQTLREREHAWALAFSSRPVSAISYPRKPFDIISQGECSIEMLMDDNGHFLEQNEDNLGRDFNTLSQFAILNDTDNKINAETTSKTFESVQTPDSYIDMPPNCAPLATDFEPIETTLTGHLTTNGMQHEQIQANATKKRAKLGFLDVILDERSPTCTEELPAINNDEIREEMKKLYDDIC